MKLGEMWNGMPTWQKGAAVVGGLGAVALGLWAAGRRTAAPAVSSSDLAPVSVGAGSTDGGAVSAEAVTDALSDMADAVVAGQQGVLAELRSQEAARASTVSATNNVLQSFMQSVSSQIDAVVAQVAPAAGGGVMGTHTGGNGRSGAGGLSGPVTVTDVPVVVAPIITPAALTAVTLPTWVDHDQFAGYVERTVQVDPSSEYQQGVLAAKSAYKAAETAGNQAGKDAAHADAERWRALAKTNDVTLPDWAK